MSIHGIDPALGGASAIPGLARPRIGDEPAPVPARQAELAPAAQHPSQRPASELVPSQAPDGTDPALWKVLSADERAFFARAREMGPLTYGPGQSTEPKIPTSLQGGRIDVRV